MPFDILFWYIQLIYYQLICGWTFKMSLAWNNQTTFFYKHDIENTLIEMSDLINFY
jgi:hypothetical protein